MSLAACCGFINGGSPAPVPVPPSALCGTPICIDEQTTENETITIDIGTVPADGAAVTFGIRLDGQGTDGDRGFYFAPEGNGARNNNGNNLVTPILVGPVGYTDLAAPPWTTLGVPAGWGAFVAFAGNTLQLGFDAAAGQPAHWRGIIWRWAHNGAALP